MKVLFISFVFMLGCMAWRINQTILMRDIYHSLNINLNIYKTRYIGEGKVLRAKAYNERAHKFSAKYFDLERVGQLNSIELSKQINYVIYNFCENKQPHTRVLEDLFDNCKTSCGGYSYLFQEVARSLGLETRGAFLYNVPSQGNHALVEVEISSGRWVLFDPTYGSFFTKDGKVEGIPLSMDELMYSSNTTNVGKKIVQATYVGPVGLEEKISFDLSSDYEGRKFKASYFKPEYYLYAESYGHESGARPIFLEMTIPLDEGSFSLGQNLDDQVLSGQIFLEKTNATLNDQVEDNDISYQMSFLGPMRSGIYHHLYGLTGMKINTEYMLVIEGVSVLDSVKLYPSILSKAGRLKNTDPIMIHKGRFRLKIIFRPLKTALKLEVQLDENARQYIRIFQIQAMRKGKTMTSAGKNGDETVWVQE